MLRCERVELAPVCDFCVFCVRVVYMRVLWGQLSIPVSISWRSHECTITDKDRDAGGVQAPVLLAAASHNATQLDRRQQHHHTK